jgi:hypothetical protein
MLDVNLARKMLLPGSISTRCLSDRLLRNSSVSLNNQIHLHQLVLTAKADQSIQKSRKFNP